MNAKLLVLWNRVNNLASNPLTALLALVLVTAAFGANLLSSNRFDPGMQFTNFLQNALQLILLFVACALSAKSAKHLVYHSAAMHDTRKQVAQITSVAQSAKCDAQAAHERLDRMKGPARKKTPQKKQATMRKRKRSAKG